MKYVKIALYCFLTVFIMAQACPAQEQEKSNSQKRAERIRALEERFAAASQEGKTIKGVLIEGNSLFNGTVDIRTKPYGKPYTDAELKTALRSAERNSKVFLVTKDGTMYYPTVKQGEADSESMGGYRFERMISYDQKDRKVLPWATLTPLVGREIEVMGTVYPGYAGVKGLYIEALAFEGEYVRGQGK
jgi:hypothetical protein